MHCGASHPRLIGRQIIFHAARVAPEKAVLRPALPMCFPSGSAEKQVIKKLNYGEQLKHPLWQRKRLEVFEKFNFTCFACDGKEKTLHAHHKSYIKGRQAWDYEVDNFEALCEDCHKETHESKELLNSVIAQFPSIMLTGLAAVLVGYGEECVDPALWLEVDELRARAGQMAWLMLNLDGGQLQEAIAIFKQIGPDGFMAALGRAVNKDQAAVS